MVAWLAPATAHAELATTAQAGSDDGGFLAFAPAPAQQAGLCLVDTGVNINPDTQSAVVDRTAIDGGSGDDVSPATHGTVMAMMAAAPANGWGMVGTAPTAIRIVSVRILEPGQATFPFAYYTAGISVCLQLQQEYNIRVINLSLGSSVTPSSQDYAAIANSVREANNYGVNVVAAAGNDDGGPLAYPAAYPAVLSVGATDTQGGAFCSFSNRGAGLRLIAPGCYLDGADPTFGMPNRNYWQGTSESSAIAAAALTALRAYRPDLSVQVAENLLTGASSGRLDIAQSFRNAGLGAIVAAGQAGAPSPPPTTSAPAAPSPTTTGAAPSATQLSPLPKPVVRLARARGALLLTLTNMPAGMHAELRVLGHRRRARRLSILQLLSITTTKLRITAVAVVEISVRFADPHDASRTSTWTTIHAPPAKTSPVRERGPGK